MFCLQNKKEGMVSDYSDFFSYLCAEIETKNFIYNGKGLMI